MPNTQAKALIRKDQPKMGELACNGYSPKTRSGIRITTPKLKHAAAVAKRI
jgi:hypothetical protein